MTPKDRLAIWERDQRTCGICGEAVLVEDLEIDHIEPRMLGGLDDESNLRAAHEVCNRKRGHSDQRRYGFWRGRPSVRHCRRAGHLVMGLRPNGPTLARLAALERKLDLSRTAVIQLAVARPAELERVEVEQTQEHPDG